MSGTSLESKAVVCWGSISVTAGRGCDSVGTISTVSYVDTYRLCTLLSKLAKDLCEILDTYKHKYIVV